MGGINLTTSCIKINKNHGISFATKNSTKRKMVRQLSRIFFKI